MKKLIAGLALAVVVGTAAPASATYIVPDGVIEGRERPCYLKNRREVVQLMLGIRLDDGRMIRMACDFDDAPWGEGRH